jgi:hypothetical protein
MAKFPNRCPQAKSDRRVSRPGIRGVREAEPDAGGHCPG